MQLSTGREPSIRCGEKYNVGVQKRVLGVLGGRDLSGPLFKLWADSAHILIAADSGADFVIEHGLRPHAIVGDMDSISPETLGLGIDVFRDDDQNHTDCEKMLAHVERGGHTSITLLGAEGDRVDHFFATLHASVKTSLDVRLAIRDGIARVLAPGHYRIPAFPGRRVSVLPLLPSEGVRLKGVRWPIRGALLAVGDYLSISNEAVEPFLDLEFESGALLVAQEYRQQDLPIWPDTDGLAILAE